MKKILHVLRWAAKQLTLWDTDKHPYGQTSLFVNKADTDVPPGMQVVVMHTFLCNIFCCNSLTGVHVNGDTFEEAFFLGDSQQKSAHLANLRWFSF